MAKTERIDFISSYCDRWCERCAFTDRCSAFACDVAIGMCGDVAAGIELAFGIPESGRRYETRDRRGTDACRLCRTIGPRTARDWTDRGSTACSSRPTSAGANVDEIRDGRLDLAARQSRHDRCTGRSPLQEALDIAAGHLRRAVLTEFPNALSFIRPGFDEPWTR